MSLASKIEKLVNEYLSAEREAAEALWGSVLACRLVTVPKSVEPLPAVPAISRWALVSREGDASRINPTIPDQAICWMSRLETLCPFRRLAGKLALDLAESGAADDVRRHIADLVAVLDAEQGCAAFVHLCAPGGDLSAADLLRLFAELIDAGGRLIGFLRGGRAEAAQSETVGANEWSEARTPSEWCRMFGVALTTIKSWEANGQIRIRKIHSKLWQVHVDDVERYHK